MCTTKSDYRHPFLILFFSFLLFPGAAAAQNSPKAEKVHEYSPAGCDSERGHIDVLLRELKNAPSLGGVVVIHPDRSGSIEVYRQRHSTIGHLRFRGFDESRIRFVLRKPDAVYHTELWKAPIGELDNFNSMPWDWKLASDSNPSLIHATSWEGGIGCEFVLSPEFFANLLRANKDQFGRIVIRASSEKEFRKERSHIMETFVASQNLLAKRIEFAFIEDPAVDIEYWLIPTRVFWKRDLNH
jgi:hypothetical protein